MSKKHQLPGGEKRVTNDPMEATYIGIKMWAQAVEQGPKRLILTPCAKPSVTRSCALRPALILRWTQKTHHLHKTRADCRDPGRRPVRYCLEYSTDPFELTPGVRLFQIVPRRSRTGPIRGYAGIALSRSLRINGHRLLSFLFPGPLGGEGWGEGDAISQAGARPLQAT